MSSQKDLDGFDPLAEADDPESLRSIKDQASKRIVHNILKSYTGFFDLFSETLQNALDAVEARSRDGGKGYKPRIWINIDIPDRRVRVVDNGIGMDEKEMRYFLRPNVSFKRPTEYRGNKGVGATFLSYGFSYFKVQSKRAKTGLGVVLRGGRGWAEDSSGTVPRPRFESVAFEVPELAGEDGGTAVEIIVGQVAGERPKDLGWIGATTAEQWNAVLRIKTPLGGVYLSTPPFRPEVHLVVRSAAGTVTEERGTQVDYFFPHENIPGVKVQTVRDIKQALDATEGDTQTKLQRLAPEYKRLDVLYDVWDSAELVSTESFFESALDDDMRALIERHKVIVYACFLRSARMWGELNDDTLKLRRGQRIIHGGLQIASDFMVQGDLAIIPLTSTIGYQANCHVVVHYTEGNPDMGRKTFQPEHKALAEVLAVRAVNVFKRYLTHLKPDAGGQTITPDKELYDWKKQQEAHRDSKPLAFQHGGQLLPAVSEPQQEQDVIALFHELLGMGILRGYRFFGTTQSDRYDSLFFLDYPADASFYFERSKMRLGVNRALMLPHTSEPKVLEYKYTFDGLVADIDNEQKFAKQIDLVVCWSVGSAYREKYYFQSLLTGDEGSGRQCFGATHHVFQSAGNQPLFEVLVLDDLLRFLRDPEDEEVRQRRAYRD